MLLATFLMACKPTTASHQQTSAESPALHDAMQKIDSLQAAGLSFPLTRIAVTSATQVGFLNALDRLDVVCASSTPERMYNLQGRTDVAHLGEDFQLNIEQLLLVHPQLLLLTDYGFEVTGADRIAEAGIPILYLSEWRESSPLARAEWLRLIARLVGEEARADSILTVVNREYQHLLNGAKPIANRRKVMCGQSFRGTWYAAAGGTYLGALLRDAQADYCYLDNPSTESIPLTVEQAVLNFRDADVWLAVNANSMTELAALDDKHTWLKAYQQQDVWNWNLTATPTGANDYWETGVVRPDYILSDIIYALYPDQMQDYKAHFISRLN